MRSNIVHRRGTPTRSSITDIYINVDHRSSITQFDRDRKSSIVNRKLFHNRSSIANRYFHNRSSIINRDCEKLLQKAKQSKKLLNQTCSNGKESDLWDFSSVLLDNYLQTHNFNLLATILSLIFEASKCSIFWVWKELLSDVSKIKKKWSFFALYR